MAKVIGRLTTIFIGNETTRGTLGTPTFAVPTKTLSIDDKPTYVHNDSAYGNISEHNASDVINVTAEGGYDGKVFDHIIGAELRAVFGQAPTTTDKSGAKQHVFKMINNNSHDALSIFVKEPEQKYSYELGMVESFTITAAIDDYLMRAIDFKSRRSKPWVPATPPAFTRGHEFLARNLAVKMADNAAGLAASPARKIKSFSLEISKNLDVQYVFGTDTPDDIQNQQLNVTGSFDYYPAQEDVRQVCLSGKPQAIQFIAENKAVEIGTSQHPTLQFDFPTVAITEDSRSRDNNAVETRSAKFQANYSLEDAAAITATLINMVTKY